MLSFLLYTILALLTNASMAKILHISIQQGQWLDVILGWQHRLQRWDIQGWQFLAKAGGYCEVCFSHTIAFIGFWIYTFFMNAVLGLWVTDISPDILVTIAINLIWYLVYTSLSTNLSLYFIVKLFNHD